MNHHTGLSHVTYLLIVLSLVGSCLSHLGQKVRIAHMYGKRDKQDLSELPLTRFLVSLGQRVPSSIGELYDPNRRTGFDSYDPYRWAGSDLDEPLFAHILSRDLEDQYSFSDEYTLDQNGNIVLENKPDHKYIFELIDKARDRSNKNKEILSTNEEYMPVLSTKNMPVTTAKKHIRKLYPRFPLPRSS